MTRLLFLTRSVSCAKKKPGLSHGPEQPAPKSLCVLVSTVLKHGYRDDDTRTALASSKAQKKVVFEHWKLNALYYFLHLPILGYAALLHM